jgi:hypothetical protein
MLPSNTDLANGESSGATGATIGANYQTLYEEERKHTELLREVVVRLLKERYGVV